MRMNWLRLILGKPYNPFSVATQRSILLIAFFAWIGLGSDGLSSANYGPEQAFRALGPYPMLGLYLAIALVITVFIISTAYNQVIELFPDGGGGYKVANELVHPLAGLVSGSALIVDYILTIAISTAAAVDALFSLLPFQYMRYSLPLKILMIIFLMVLNLRGMKESIQVLLPIFLGFVITHAGLIVYGIFAHESELPVVLKQTVTQSQEVAQALGWGGMLALLLHAYSLGGGTFTGLEAVSNNVNVLAEPRIKTGKWTMFYMAVSLGFTAGGITLLYMLWHVTPVPGETYNAILFDKMLGGFPHGHAMLVVVLAFEAGILLLGANTGFLGGPAVVANMAADGWCPSIFSNLSSRLVKQNGIILFGVGAILIMWLAHGHVSFLIVLYSANVFLTFSITLFGLTKHWWQIRREQAAAWRKLPLALLGFIICLAILLVILISKFMEGGWLTIVITGLIVTTCYLIHRHYQRFARKLKDLDQIFSVPAQRKAAPSKILDPNLPTAVFFVGTSRAVGIHTVLWSQRLFPNQYKNYIFAQVGSVDVSSFRGAYFLEKMTKSVEENLKFFANYAQALGFPTKTYSAFGTNVVHELTELAMRISEEFPNCVFFAGKTMLAEDNLFTRILHNDTAIAVQRKLHFEGKQMIVLPMKVEAV